MYKDILNYNQTMLLGLIRQFKNNFYMAGGTAIALQIGHRHSIDFDLFAEESLNALKIIRLIKKAGFTIEATLEDSPEELTIVVNGVKITFLEYPFKIERSVDFDGILTMPDLLTLSAMKAYSLGKRSKWKDYIDLYFIIKDYFSIKDISRRAKEIYAGGVNERLFREQLCYFEDIDFSEAIDFAGEPISDEIIKDFLKKVCVEI